MPRVCAISLPSHVLLQRYQADGGYADCYVVDVPLLVSHEAFVIAFYTTRVFKLERWLLRVLADRPSRDGEAEQLAAGSRNTFAAWTVEARAPSELLLCDMNSRTRSWLMTTPGSAAGSTRLFFGSAVVPAVHRATGQRRMGRVFHMLLGFHRVYSAVLLASAARALTRSAAP